jgi:hypothetical protein
MVTTGLSRIARLAWGPLFGLVGLGLVGAMPAAAQSNACDTSSGVQVWLLGLQQDQDGHQGIILGSQEDGSFAGTFQVHIVCNGPTSTSDVTGAMVDMCSVLANPVANASLRISGVGFDPTGTNASVDTPAQTANCTIDTSSGVVSGQPASISVPFGYANVTFTSSTPLPDHSDFAFVGRQSVILAQAYGDTLQTGQNPLTFSMAPAFSPGVWAKTPELDSLFLFGSGAAGFASYAMLRLRAARRRGDK